MRINFSDYDLSGFDVKPCQIAGNSCRLITAKREGCVYTTENLIFRSSIWTDDGQPVSLGFKKFFNYTEKPDIVADPTNDDFTNVQIPMKMDGSLLIISKFHGELICRTRGSISASAQPNGEELAEFQRRYPKLFDNDLLTDENHSILCEWTSPNNRIVIDYGSKPELYLVGIVNHRDYSYWTQQLLDFIAVGWGVPRPKYFQVDTLSRLIAIIKPLVGGEGCCIYYKNGQEIKKLKADAYLKLHAYKAQCSRKKLLKQVLDMWEAVQFGTLTADEFADHLKATKDFESYEFARPILEKIFAAKNYIDILLGDIKQYSMYVAKKFPISRDAAKEILNGQFAQYSGCVFNMVNQKPLTRKNYEWLFEDAFEKFGMQEEEADDE